MPAERGVGGWATRLKENKRHKLPVIKSVRQREVVCSTVNIVHNTVISLYSDRWLLDVIAITS